MIPVGVSHRIVRLPCRGRVIYRGGVIYVGRVGYKAVISLVATWISRGPREFR